MLYINIIILYNGYKCLKEIIFNSNVNTSLKMRAKNLVGIKRVSYNIYIRNSFMELIFNEL